MKITFAIIFAALTISLSAQDKTFEPNLASFEANYKFPEWFRDAKFGIWSHWGPQAVPRKGDWYAQRMYWEGGKWREYHEAHYGHPSKIGYRGVIEDWKAEKWDPEKLMKLYKKAGARYFVSMGVHHDNFWLWDSKIHRWNSVQMGPKRDIVGDWQKAAKKEGLYFGISEHLGASYTWFCTSHWADKEGKYKDIPYDGENPDFQDLYHKKPAPDDTDWYTKDPENHKHWLKAMKEMLDLYNPDLLYSDGGQVFDGVGLEMISHFYNTNQTKNKGKFTAIYTCKSGEAKPYWVLDFERGKLDGISPFPWQTDSSVGDWYYDSDDPYMNSTQVIHMLTDIVSKNGNLLLNIVQTPEGDLDPALLELLDDLAIWFKDNGEGIHGTRPWKLFGEGPSTEGKREKGNHGGSKELESTPFTSNDFRFTQKDGNVYAFCMSKPEKARSFKIISLGKNSNYQEKPVKAVKMMGVKQKLRWEQKEDALYIEVPEKMPKYKTVAFKISF